MMNVGNFMPKTKKAEDSFCDEEAMLEIVSQDAAGIEPPVKAYRLTTAQAMRLAGMSQEALRFLHASSGYDAPSIGLQMDDIPRLKGQKVDKYVRPMLGMQEIPKAMHRAFAKAAPGKAHMNWKLISVKKHSTGDGPSYELLFYKTSTNPCDDTTNTIYPIETKRVITRRLILAIPKGPLDFLHFDDPVRYYPDEGFDNAAQRHFMTTMRNGVVGVELMKIFVG